MDEDLNILNVTYDSIIQQQVDLRLPEISKRHRNSTADKKYMKKSLKINNKLKINVENPYEQSFLTNRSIKKPRLNDTSTHNNLTHGNWKNFSVGFTPKLKKLVKAAPINELIMVSPRSISLNSTRLSKSSECIIDWKQSILENHIISNKCEFNWEKDPSLLSGYQIKQIKEVGHGFVMKNCIRNTFKKLCNELMQNDFYIDKITDNQLLIACKWLFKFRESTLYILNLIHEREYLLLRLITDSKEVISDIQQNFMRITIEIINKITEWKRFKISRKKFVYIGENYLKKIDNDLAFLEIAYTSI